VARDAAVVGEAFTLACGEGRRLVDLVHLIAETLGKPVDLRLEAPRPGEVTWYVADISKARRVLGFAPRVPVPDGIRKAMAWAQEYEAQRTVTPRGAAR
jgi:UDP-glucuronate 4-epimerase